jgi:Fe-S-cluster containining protein
MHCSQCGICCTKTEMLLTKEDMKKLEKNGHKRKDFARQNTQGYYKLRNHQGHCVFYDQNLQRCIVYVCRPTGCKIYPVIYSVEEGVIADNLCPMNNSISQTELQSKGKAVMKLLATIDSEAAERLWSKKGKHLLYKKTAISLK